MLLEPVLYGVALAALLAASYTDLKTREVPDWLSYGLIFSALGIRALFSLGEADGSILLRGLAGLAVFVAIAYIMYYTHQWGGGDSKLLMGLGAVIGLDFRLFPLPAIAVFFAFLMLAGAAYGLCWLLVLAVRNARGVANHFGAFTRRAQARRNATFIASGVLLLALLLTSDASLRLLLLLLVIMPIALFYLLALVKSVEDAALRKAVRPTQLTEGDWIGEDVVVQGKRIARASEPGLTKEQITKLRRLYRQKKLFRVVLRNGIPFVPSFLIALVALILAGSGGI